MIAGDPNTSNLGFRSSLDDYLAKAFEPIDNALTRGVSRGRNTIASGLDRLVDTVSGNERDTHNVSNFVQDLSKLSVTSPMGMISSMIGGPVAGLLVDQAMKEGDMGLYQHGGQTMQYGDNTVVGAQQHGGDGGYATGLIDGIGFEFPSTEGVGFQGSDSWTDDSGTTWHGSGYDWNADEEFQE